MKIQCTVCNEQKEGACMALDKPGFIRCKDLCVECFIKGARWAAEQAKTVMPKPEEVK